MKLTGTTMTLAMTCLWPVAVFAQIALVRDAEPQRVFAGEARPVAVVWHNEGNQLYAGEIRTRMLQTSSATAVPVGETPWKQVQVLPGQTVLESVSLDFPAVKAETKFLVQWLDNTNRVIGKTEVLVYPTNLLAELKTLAGEDPPVGVFDPGNVLKPLLKKIKVPFEDLQDSGVATFSGKLAILGPFESREQMPGDLAERMVKLAGKGAGVVWLRPPPEPHAKLKPTFYTVPVGSGAVVVAQATFVAKLTEDPQAQLNLLHCCRLAQKPEPLALPDFSPQP
jgi:hypothetical protein